MAILESLRKILFLSLLATTVLLAGCATAPYIADKEGQQRLSTSDPEQIATRFGIMATLADRTWLTWYRGGGGKIMTGRWMVPGVQLRVETMDCFGERCHPDHFDLYYDAAERVLAWHCFGSLSDGAGGCDSLPFYRGKVQGEGGIDFKSSMWNPDVVVRQDPVSGTIQMEGFTYRLVSSEEARKVASGWQQMVAAKSRESSRASSELWGNVSMALLAGAQSYAAERQQQLAEEQQRQYEANVRAAQAAEEARARAEAAQRANDARRQAAQRANQARLQPQPASKPLPRPTQVAAARHVQQPAPARAERTLPAVQKVALAAPAAAAAKPETVAKANKPELFPYPEAVVVCTIPDAKGHFSCDDPLHQGEGGGPNGMKEDRTPEAKVASIRHDVCRGAHRLRSSTHLVWGCGFAATGVSPYMDRAGPGVDVQGRHVYYCPKDYPFTCTNRKP